MGLAYERTGSGPPLVLLHGVGHRRQAWGAVLDRLTPHRDVIAVDLPGHGESPPLPPIATPVLTVLLDQVTALFDELGLGRPRRVGDRAVPGRVLAQRPRRPVRPGDLPDHGSTRGHPGTAGPCAVAVHRGPCPRV